MKVNLYYYTLAGKYITEGSFETNRKRIYNIVGDVRAMLRLHTLPGIDMEKLIIIIDVPGHPDNSPQLIIGKEEE